jgi:hemoglobin
MRVKQSRGSAAREPAVSAIDPGRARRARAIRGRPPPVPKGEAAVMPAHHSPTFVSTLVSTFAPALAPVLALLVAGCGTAAGGNAGAGPPPAGATLYQRLGGQPAITAVVDDFVARLGKDERINARFANADLPRLRALLIEQICEAAGGPCKYTGRDMRTSHAGMGIAAEEFTALVEDLQATLNAFKVPAREQGELLAVLGPMKPDIVEEGAVRPGSAAAGLADPVANRARGFRQAAGLLDKAAAARARGQRSLADQLFSAAELIVGADVLAPLAGLFREGAPPRVTTAPVPMADGGPQPAAAGSSQEDGGEDEAAAAAAERAPRRGSLTGQLRLEGGGDHAAAGPDGLAVVTLEPLAAGGRARRRPPRRRVIEQRNREFAPRVLAVPVGSTVSFPNFDGIFHNVFSRSEARPFDLGLYTRGQARELVFDREGVVRIGCNLHANMLAYVVVVSAPHYVVSDPGGRFSFRSVEPGRYRLRVYSDRSQEPVTREVVIEPQPNSVTVTIPAQFARPAGPLADKFGAPRDSGKGARESVRNDLPNGDRSVVR